MNKDTNENLEIANAGKDWAAIGNRSEKMADKNGDGQKTSSNDLSDELPKDLLEHPSYLKLLNDLTKAEQERDTYRDQLLLVRADLENAKRRFDRDLDNAYKYAINELLSELLPVIDSMEMGLATKNADGMDNGLLKQVYEGMQLTLDLLLKILRKHGVEQIDPANGIFDHNRHEAMAVQEAPGAKTNSILKVVQKGYLLKERLIRPALVIVAK